MKSFQNNWIFATIFAVFAFFNRLEQEKTKIWIQIRDLHCLLGLVDIEITKKEIIFVEKRLIVDPCQQRVLILVWEALIVFTSAGEAEMTMPRSRLDGPHTAQAPPNQVTAPQKTLWFTCLTEFQFFLWLNSARLPLRGQELIRTIIFANIAM